MSLVFREPNECHYSYQPILLQPAVTALRTEFGSLDQRITHIVYSNGELDPWLYNGMLFTRDDETEVINIARKLYLYIFVGKTFKRSFLDHSKSADLTSISTADPIALYLAKQQIRERILNWVS